MTGSPFAPRITFGIIVLNGEPFTRYCLRALYPYAHQIIVVEGAVATAAATATADGHSVDGTLDTLRQFQAAEDPEHKVEIITRDGFWAEKDEMSQAFAARATGDYLWQVDVDEFYRDEDIQTVMTLLRDDPSITALSFRMVTFWGNFDTITDGWFLRHEFTNIHRVFGWGSGYRYVTHRPPTVHDDQGRDVRTVHWVSGDSLEKQHGIRMFHYSLVFPKQVSRKSSYYQRAAWAHHARKADEWAERAYMKLERPYRVHNVYRYPSWLERFRGEHPAQIQALIAELRVGKLNVELRPTEDVERLLRSPLYQAGRFCLRISGSIWAFARARQWPGRAIAKRAFKSVTRAG